MAYSTETTIIAAFRNASDAQAAARDLQTAGIPQSNIFLESGSSTGSSTSNYATRSTQHEGGVSGWFKSLFQDDDADDRGQYERAMGSGSYLLSIDAREEQVSSIEAILNRHNPVNVDVENESAGATAAQTAPRRATAGTAADATGTVPVVEEELQVGKRRILRGGVRVYSRVVEQPVQESISLEEEHVRVQRQKVDRPASDADFAAGKEQVIEVQEFADQPVVSKQARVVEEVRVGKERTARTENISDKVRHTEVNVEPVEGGTSGSSQTGGSNLYENDFRQDFQTRYGASARFEDYSPGYNYGYQSASDPRYQGRRYEDVESDLRADYGRRYPEGTWDKIKDSVRYGWDKVTGKSGR